MDLNVEDVDLEKLEAQIQGHNEQPVVIPPNALVPFPMQNRLLGENIHENTCFMNVVIQALYHLKPFRELIQRVHVSLVDRVDYSFIQHLQKIFDLNTSSDDRLENVKALQRALNFEEGQQASFVEFLRNIFIKLSSFQRVDLDAFTIKYRLVPRKGSSDERRELFVFEVTGEAKEFISMQACLNEYTEVNAKSNVFSHQIVFHGAPPEALSFHLGNGAPLCIESSIKLNFKIRKDNNKFVKSPQDSIYELYAVITKTSPLGNHFHCYARDSSYRGSTWLLFNDDTITRVPDNDIVVALRGKLVSHVFYKLTSAQEHTRDLKRELLNNVWYDDTVNEVVNAVNELQNTDERVVYAFDTTESAVFQQNLPTNALWVNVICKLLQKPFTRKVRSERCVNVKQISKEDYVRHLPDVLFFTCHVAHNVIVAFNVQLQKRHIYVLNYLDVGKSQTKRPTELQAQLDRLITTLYTQFNTLYPGKWEVSLEIRETVLPQYTAGECLKDLATASLSLQEPDLKDTKFFHTLVFDKSHNFEVLVKNRDPHRPTTTALNFWVSVYAKVTKRNAQPNPENVPKPRRKRQQSPSEILSQIPLQSNQAPGSGSGSVPHTVKGVASPDVENYDAYREFLLSDKSLIPNFENVKTLDEACKQINRARGGRKVREEEEEEEEKEDGTQEEEKEGHEEQLKPAELFGGSGSRSRKNVVVVYLNRSTRKEKKYMALVNGKTVHFGARGMSDFTKHHDKERLKRYLLRHRAHENWTRKGMATAGFWSRWLLWNKPSKRESIRDIENRFHILIRH